MRGGLQVKSCAVFVAGSNVETGFVAAAIAVGDTKDLASLFPQDLVDELE
jgi:hypothetical protein